MPDDAIHQSGLSALRTCEQQFAYDRMLRLEPRYLSTAPTLGTWVHAMLGADDIARGWDEDTLIRVPEVLDLPGRPMVIHQPDEGIYGDHLRGERGRVEGPLDGQLVIEAATHWWNREAGGSFQDDYRSRYRDVDLPDHLADLWERYSLRWDVEDDGRLEVLAVEVEWTRSVRGRGGEVVPLAGRVDVVLRDTRYGLVVVRDRKTHGQWPSEPQFVQDLMNSQLHLYAWGVAPMLAEAGIGPPSALEWDRIRTKPPTTPALTKAGRLSKSVSDYDLPTYLAWANQHPEYDGTRTVDPGVYEVEDEVVEHLSSEEERDRFYFRRRFPVNEDVIRTHVAMALEDHHAIEALQEDPSSAVRSPGRHCSWCDYLTLCRGQLFGEVADDFDPHDFNLIRKADA